MTSNQIMLKISFVVINRNNQKYINRCIKSINNINYPRKEIIVVDDYSTDESVQKLKYKIDTLIRNRNQKGIAFSRNKGIKKSRGDLVFIIDSDIQIIKIELNKIIEYFLNNIKLIAISGNYYSSSNTNWNSVLDLRRKSLFHKNNQTFFYNLKKNYTTFSGGFCCLHRKRLKETSQNGELKTGGEDLYFQLSMLNQGWQFGYVAEFRGKHLHKRELFNTFKKVNREAKGDAWLIFEAFQHNLNLPIFEPIYSIPIFLIFGLVFMNPILILIEISPCLILIAKQRNQLSAKLFIYEMVLSILRFVYILGKLISRQYSLETKLKFIKHIISSVLIGKYYSISKAINYEYS